MKCKNKYTGISFSPADCPGDTEFTYCGSSCPSTCDSLDGERLCTQQCVPGV